ncbi:MAG: Holliday junction resolvase RuvX [Planctomycetota bacterium]|nr:Holliday junction resolvase RuvX [Planctomycetota bacterium]
MTGRVLGVDLGGKRIGLAISDSLRYTAQVLDVIQNKSEPDVLRQIGKAVEEHQVVLVVVGLPIKMDGSQGPEAKAAIRFAMRLRDSLGISVETWDERLSSVQADRFLAEAEVRGKKRKRLQDQLAAQIILQSFLDASSLGG